MSVEIRYPTRSKFIEACEAAIRHQSAALETGETVRVGLLEGGYHGQIVVTIDPDERTGFGTDWEGVDPTRFPARIRAAAAALRNCRIRGQFEVSHLDGSMTIRAVSRS